MIKEIRYVITVVMMLGSGFLLARFPTATARLTDDFQEREEINRKYQLAPAASVQVSGIRGPVEIFNTDTTTAEVQVIRTARTRADLEYHKVEVEQLGNSVVVRGVQEPQASRGQNVQVNHHVIIKVPRRVNLAVTSVSGWLRVADTDGQTKVNSISGSAIFGNVGGSLQVRSISGDFQVGSVGADALVTSVSGDVRVGQLNGSLDVSSVSGSVKATVDRLDTGGIHIKSVSGSVEIGFKGEVNADFNAEGFSGRVYLEIPGVSKESEVKSSQVRARIGVGGSPIMITGVSGNIRLTRS